MSSGCFWSSARFFSLDSFISASRLRSWSRSSVPYFCLASSLSASNWSVAVLRLASAVVFCFSSSLCFFLSCSMSSAGLVLFSAGIFQHLLRERPNLLRHPHVELRQVHVQE